MRKLLSTGLVFSLLACASVPEAFDSQTDQLAPKEPRTAGLWLWGVERGWVLSGYNMYREYAVAQRLHKGTDIRLEPGQAIHALAPGVVYRVRDYGSIGGYNQEITMHYPSVGVYVLYGHVKAGVSAYRRPGQTIAPGEVIAYGGTAADALYDYPHVHVQVWRDRAAADTYTNDAAMDPETVRPQLFARLPAGAGPFGMCEAGDGRYCGSDGALYRCTNGTATKIETCALGCDAGPVGLDDACNAPACPSGDGLFCGGEGVSGNDFTVYQCAQGTKTIASVCGSGTVLVRCTRGACVSPTCPVGDGLYCGGNMIGGDQRVLYRCTGGTMTAAQTCTRGCQVMPTGTDDRCL